MATGGGGDGDGAMLRTQGSREKRFFRAFCVRCLLAMTVPATARASSWRSRSVVKSVAATTPSNTHADAVAHAPRRGRRVQQAAVASRRRPGARVRPIFQGVALRLVLDIDTRIHIDIDTSMLTWYPYPTLVRNSYR